MADKDVYTAEGRDLDEIGRSIGTFRLYGEHDADYRQRVIVAVQLRVGELAAARDVAAARERDRMIQEGAKALATAEGQALNAAVAVLLQAGARLDQLELVHELGTPPARADEGLSLSIIRRCYVRLRAITPESAIQDEGVDAACTAAVARHRAAIASKLREVSRTTGIGNERFDRSSMGSSLSWGDIMGRWADEIERGTFGIPNTHGGG